MHDVVVVGGGNAALCAALSACAAGASVLMLERASLHDRGGNSRHTRDMRCVSEEFGYTEQDMLAELTSVSGESMDRELATIAVEGSREAPAWMESMGVRWQPALRGTLGLHGTNRFYLGGGKALINIYYARARALGIDVEYGMRVDDVLIDKARTDGVLATDATGVTRNFGARAVVVASGGFDANIEWLRGRWGDAADNFIVRGSPLNDGRVLSALLGHGARERGNPHGFHATAVDARSPRADGGIVTRVDSIPLGIAVDSAGRRFYDEGEELWPKRYAVWGGLIAQRPDQLAYTVFDAKAWGKFIPSVYPPFASDTLGGLAEQLGLPPNALEQTVTDFNAAASPASPDCTQSRLDGHATTDLTPPKSNWAHPIDTAPYRAYPLRPGITFTYLGVAVDKTARVLADNGRPFENLFAAGEVMAGNILRKGYLAGFGMTIGTVFGRLAGAGAARAAR
ncbi:MAG: FAD-dependent tricarballylate dehydrogenase TcuA [Chloroflexota bacterium]|nr:FAD-dependent tricarballylate dehydrogenase TcuA [Chloroflexota bacterium]